MGLYSWFQKPIAVFALSSALFGPAHADSILIMFDDQGCPYCDLWKAQIGPIYPKTEESLIAPLLMIDIDGPLPEGISIVSNPIYTPTFVLVNNGEEVGRILGYPGEDFFWGLLDRMIDKMEEENTEGRT